MGQITSPVVTPDFSSSTPVATTIWDRRPIKYSNILTSVCLFILVMELAERLSYYGINQGLKNFMHDKLGIDNASSTSLKNTWTSVCYLTPVLGAWIADEKWGRYKTIIIFGIWYLIGDFLVAFGAHPTLVKDNKGLSKAIFLIGLFGGIGIGTGAIKSNVITFGADQFDENKPEELKQRGLYFSLFYWSINIGSTFSYGYLSTVCVNGSGIISKENGYFATFLICACVMLVSILVFISGANRFVHVPPAESALTKLVDVIYKSTKYSHSAKFIVGGYFAFMLAFIINLATALVITGNPTFDSRPYAVVAGLFSIVGVFCWVIFGMDPTYMNSTKISNGGIVDDRSINEVKLVVRVLPWAAFNIIWHCVYDQIDASFQSITQQCDLRFGSSLDASQIPGATLALFDPLTIIIMIPILDYVIYPAYTRFFKKKPSSFGKAAVGLVLASIAMIWTGIFEIIRRNSGALEGNQCFPPGSDDCKYILAEGGQVPMNKLYWAANIFQYMLVGSAECLINVTSYDVFYSSVPDYLKSTCQSINLLMTSMGSNVASIFTLLFHKYITDDLNNGHIEYMFFAVAGVSIVNTIVFVISMTKMQFGVHDAAPINLKLDEESVPDMQKRHSSRVSTNSIQRLSATKI